AVRRCCFLQEEDGIRDWSVTGVQTCALPISVLIQKRHPDQHGRSEQESLRNEARQAHAAQASSIRSSRLGKVATPMMLGCVQYRSEERRVGKGRGARGCSDAVSKNVGSGVMG